MTKTLISALILLLCGNALFAQDSKTKIITTDVENFWTAYDQIVQSTDSLERIQLIHDLYISRGTAGLQAMIASRRYRDDEYANAMLNYPGYWNSIRGNKDHLLKDSAQIDEYINKLQAIYPGLQPATIYFPVGVFRSAGTYQRGADPKVLLGAEFYLADLDSDIDELPERTQKGMRDYMPYDIPLIALHELIHIQQKPWENRSIVHICVAEGVAEFISTLVAEAPLSKPVQFGKLNPERVLDRFMVDIFRDNDVWNWLWSDNRNELAVNDLGYYIGYEICESYYNQAADKKEAIKTLIELDYDNDSEFSKFLDDSGFLPMTWQEIAAKYESMRPTVSRIVEFQNGSKKVSPKTKTITVEFSDPMSTCCRSFDVDDTKPGEPLKLKQAIGWHQDGKQFSFEVEALKPNTDYHLIISNFAKEDGGNRLAPYTIEFRTIRK